MTGANQYTTSFSQFAQALVFCSSGYQIHSGNKKDKPKGINDCLRFVASGLEDDDRKRKPNDISIWRQPFQFLYRCVLRTMYPKSRDKTHCSSSAITIMCHIYDHPSKRLDVPHYLWHEIRLASLQQRHLYSHAPFIMTLIQSVVTSPIEITEAHPLWTILEHMYFTA